MGGESQHFGDSQGLKDVNVKLPLHSKACLSSLTPKQKDSNTWPQVNFEFSTLWAVPQTFQRSETLFIKQWSVAFLWGLQTYLLLERGEAGGYMLVSSTPPWNQQTSTKATALEGSTS